MSNVVSISDPNTDLDTIVADIAQRATNMVTDAWHIGDRLNAAARILGDDASFGKWRKEHLDPIGITLRTAQRMQNIASRWTLDELPREMTVSKLYLIASDGVSEETQKAVIAKDAAERAEGGSGLTARDINLLVSNVHKGRVNAFEERKAAEERIKVARQWDAGEPIEGEVIEAAPEPEERVTPRQAAARARVAAAANPAQAAADWAAGIRRMLKGKGQGVRAEYLDALVAELVESGLLTKPDTLLIGVEFDASDNNQAHIVVKPRAKAKS